MRYLGVQGLFSLLFLTVSTAQAVQIFTTGSPKDAVTATSQVICLAGGGSDDAWAEGWKSMLKMAGGGDVVIIRTGGDRGEYESWIYNDDDKHGFPHVNSVRTISLEKPEDANREDVEKLIRNSEMVFFCGGDQSTYIEWFKGSRLAKAVEDVMLKKKVPVGGTSAGMALLAGIDYTGKYDSPFRKDSLVNSRDVLLDPTGQFVDLDRSVITAPYMKDVITDTHFSQRDRQGRLVGMMARATINHYDGITPQTIKGIGADEGTAVCYNEKGKATVHGAGKAYFAKGQAPIERIEPGKSLEWNAQHRAVEVYAVQGNNSQASFDLANWSGSGGSTQYWYVDGKNSKNPIFHDGEDKRSAPPQRGQK